jgi:hypothetical protein
MRFTWLGFLVFTVLATIKGAQGRDVPYSWLGAFLPLFIGLLFDGLLFAIIVLLTFLDGGTSI